MASSIAATFPNSPPQVTACFRGGTQSFVLSAGATLADLADRIAELGSNYDGSPLEIRIAFAVQKSSGRRSVMKQFVRQLRL